MGLRPKLNYGHVVYQIKANDTCSNMVANVLPTDTPSTWGWGQKVTPYFFLKVVMLHIKLKGTMKASMLFFHTPLTPGVGSKGQFFVCF